MFRILQFEFLNLIVVNLLICSIVITSTTEVPSSSTVQEKQNLTTVSVTTQKNSTITHQSSSILDQIFGLFDLLPQLKFDIETDEHNDTVLNLKLVLNNGDDLEDNDGEDDDSEDDEYEEDETDESTTEVSRNYRQGRDGGGGGKKKGKGKKKKHGKDKMSKYMSLFAIPMMIHSAMVPMMLSSLKMMLVKSILLGKLALILVFINSLRQSQNNIQEKIAVEHYGYKHGSSEEIGAWVNS